ncbi:MAG: ethanolamine ammonia-lyase reactivating factor EutA [Firmicutes bacterium]|nr:ethanolamine ammonia-lyase reactivating factor EutA [Bacillota bacterium]
MSQHVTETVLSMGLDVGTTTTILVLTRLGLKDLGSITSTPRVEIVSKEVIYVGDVHPTPFCGEEAIDEEALTRLILREYEKAGVLPGDVQSGAIIITGQAALKSNAQVLLHRLAANAGRFVVATAGPQLEALIAGRGSGAAARSRKYGHAVANLDIGGGTTNIALFSGGEPEDAIALNVGGRLIRVDPSTRMIEHISAPGLAVLNSTGLDFRTGQTVHMDRLRRLAGRLAQVLEEVMSGVLSGLASSLMIGEARGLRAAPDEICFSGGVGNLLYSGGQVSTIDEAVRFGDFGPLLAEEIRRTGLFGSPRVFRPDQTIYATVIGAGAHMTELSGSTIFLSEPGVLPLRNVPVAKPLAGSLPADVEDTKRAIERALYVIGKAGNAEPVAVALDVARPGFEEVQRLARAIAGVFAGARNAPIVVVSGGDYGKVLGQSLQAILNHDRAIVCVDQVRVESGDYIDIGEPLYGGTVVPVVVKTLVFSDE